MGTFSGTVTAVDVNGSAICVTPDHQQQQRCSVPFMRPGQPQLRQGEHVRVSVQQLDTGGGSSEEIFVITSPSPGM
jgi:hypothetical protein